mgnify:CR=1 FL=1
MALPLATGILATMEALGVPFSWKKTVLSTATLWLGFVSDTVTEADTTRLTAARGFSKAFLQNMLIEKYYIPSRVGTELKAYNHYNRGSTQLDRAIKHRFCHELRAPHELPTGTGTLQVVQHELITVLARYTDSTWVPESMIKMHLLDRFHAVVEAELSA